MTDFFQAGHSCRRVTRREGEENWRGTRNGEWRC